MWLTFRLLYQPENLGVHEDLLNFEVTCYINLQAFDTLFIKQTRVQDGLILSSFLSRMWYI